MIVFEIGLLLYRMTGTAHLGHPFSQFKTGLTGEDIMGHMTVSAGGRIFLFLQECFRMCPFDITLIFLWMALLTFFVIIEQSGNSAKKLRVWMLNPLFLDVGVALRT
jgi:hypothetical protein